MLPEHPTILTIPADEFCCCECHKPTQASETDPRCMIGRKS